VFSTSSFQRVKGIVIAVAVEVKGLFDHFIYIV